MSRFTTVLRLPARMLLGALAACVVIGLAACGSEDGAATSTGATGGGSALEQDRISVTLGGYVNEVAAKRLEVVAPKHGLEVRFVPVKTSTDYLAALLTGEADVTLLTFAHMFQAFEQGREDVVSFARNTEGGTRIVLRSGLDVPEGDFGALNALAAERKAAGDPLVLAGAHTSINYVLGRASLVENGVDMANFDEEDVGDPSLHAQLLAREKADVLITGEPAASAALEQGFGVQFALPYDTDMGAINTDWLTTREFAEENPKTLAALRAAIAEASQWVQDDREAAVESIVEYTGMEQPVVETAMDNLTFDPESQPEAAAALAKAMLEAGLVKQDWSGTVADHVMQVTDEQ